MIETNQYSRFREKDNEKDVGKWEQAASKKESKSKKKENE